MATCTKEQGSKVGDPTLASIQAKRIGKGQPRGMASKASLSGAVRWGEEHIINLMQSSGHFKLMLSHSYRDNLTYATLSVRSSLVPRATDAHVGAYEVLALHLLLSTVMFSFCTLILIWKECIIITYTYTVLNAFKHKMAISVILILSLFPLASVGHWYIKHGREYSNHLWTCCKNCFLAIWWSHQKHDSMQAIPGFPCFMFHTCLLKHLKTYDYKWSKRALLL